jgi:hypothetical protein
MQQSCAVFASADCTQTTVCAAWCACCIWEGRVYSREYEKTGCSKSLHVVLHLKSIADAERLTSGVLLHGASRLFYTQQQATQVRQPCHKHHRKHINDSPAAAVERDRSQVGAMKSTCNKDTWAGRCSAKGQTGSLQHESTGACSTQEHAGWCCRGCLVFLGQLKHTQ